MSGLEKAALSSQEETQAWKKIRGGVQLEPGRKSIRYGCKEPRNMSRTGPRGPTMAEE